MKPNFKSTTKFEDRKDKFTLLQNRYPNMTYVILEKGKEQKPKKGEVIKDIGQLKNSKFLLARELTHEYIIQYVKTQLKLDKTQTLFMWINNTMFLCDTTQIQDTYNRYKDQDGFLYMTYTGQDSTG